MRKIPYSLAIGILNYIQVCKIPNNAYIVGILSRYLSNPNMNNWKADKGVIRYLQRTKPHMLKYRRSDHLEISGYSDFDFIGCHDTRVYSMS